MLYFTFNIESCSIQTYVYQKKPFSKPISETGIIRFKTETKTEIKNETEKNWIPVLKSKPKP